MACVVGIRKQLVNSKMCFSTSKRSNSTTHTKTSTRFKPLDVEADPGDLSSILPGLPDDVAKYCLALVPRRYFPTMGGVCKRWRYFIQSKEFPTVRKEAKNVEEWLYVLIADDDGKGSHWEVLGCSGDKDRLLPPMPGPSKAGFGIVVLAGKLFVMAGYSIDGGKDSASSDVYQYDSRLNRILEKHLRSVSVELAYRWSVLARMNVARYDFGCAEVNGMIYAVGGFGSNGESLSSTEVYDADKNEWILIESLRRPRWGCFACGFEGKLYVMGGRSSFTIGNSRSMDVYDPDSHSWSEMKNGCVMVTAHAVVGEKLFCIEWKNQRKLAVFNPVDKSWTAVPVPLTGSFSIGFKFAVFDGKLFMFSMKEEPGYQTLIYDPEAPAGSDWKISSIKPSGLCLFCVTIEA